MILGQIIKGLNNEWDKQIEFREEERRIAEERGFRVEQDEKSWDRQLANQKLGWDREFKKRHTSTRVRRFTNSIWNASRV